MRFPTDVNYVRALDVIHELSQDIYDLSYDDELLTALTHGLDHFILIVFHIMLIMMQYMS